jgi:hypothetical protein
MQIQSTMAALPGFHREERSLNSTEQRIAVERLAHEPDRVGEQVLLSFRVFVALHCS